MLVVVAGRKSSGKTTIADYLRKAGYKRASFAGRLKRLTAAVYGWNEEDLWTDEGKEGLLATPVEWGREEADRLGCMIGASRPLVSTPRVFSRRREALQYIGTDVLREYDPDFHVNSLREDISAGGRHVLDDCRFVNELQLCREMGCLATYVVRPSWFDYSNHRSETELRRRHFRNIIVNDAGIEDLIAHFDNLHTAWKAGKLKADADSRKNPDKLAVPPLNILGNNRTGWMPSNGDYFAQPDNAPAYWAGVLSHSGKLGRNMKTGGSSITLTTPWPSLCRGLLEAFGVGKDGRIGNRDAGYSTEITHPFCIEDLKLWGQQAGGGGPLELPYMVKDDQSGLFHWLAGYLDAHYGPGGWPYQMYIRGDGEFLERLRTTLLLDGAVQKDGRSHGLVLSEDSSYGLMKRLWDVAGGQLETVKRLN